MFLPHGPYNPAMPSEQETILVVETGRLGDLVMATPALETLRRGAPDARIVVAGGWPLAILDHHPCVDGLVCVAHPNPRWLRLWLERRRWGRWLAGCRCRAVLICHGYDHRVWQWAARRAGVPHVFSDRLSSPAGVHHSDRLHHLALQMVGGRQATAGLPSQGDGPTPPVRLVVTDEECDVMRRRLAADGRDETRRLVAVHVGTHRLGRRNEMSRKMWPPECWKELLPDLVRTWNVQVLFTGTAGEAAVVNDVAAVLPTVAAINWCGRTGVRDLAAAIALCDLVITPDTGPMHVAAALDVPLVALFSVTSQAHIGPRGAGARHTIVTSLADCRPCSPKVQRRCRKSLCTDDITPRRVCEAADAWLAAARHGESATGGRPRG